MLEMTSMKRRIILACLLLLGFPPRHRRRSSCVGFVRGAETLPVKRWEAYQFTTLGEGKSEGHRTTELISKRKPNMDSPINSKRAFRSIQHDFCNKGVRWRPRRARRQEQLSALGGVEASAKYRVLSPFKDPLGVALRLEAGYYDLTIEVDGLRQHDRYLKPEIESAKGFFGRHAHLRSRSWSRMGLG